MKPINDRPTPLTDKAEIFFHDGDIIGYVKADFARQLERELAAANKRIAELEKENEWHLASELPSDDRRVLLAVNHYTIVGWLGIPSKQWMTNGAMVLGDIHHWRELPKPPKEGV